MNLIEYVNKNHILKEMEDSDRSIDDLFNEWRDIKKQQAVVDKMYKMMGKRVKELETQFMPLAKEAHNQQAIIDTAIIEYKTRKTTGVKYKDAFEKALELATKAQAKILTESLLAATTKGVSNSLKIIDPELEKFLAEVAKISGEEISDRLNSRIPLEKFPKNIIRSRDKVEEGRVVDFVKKTIENIGNVFNMALRKLKSSLKLGDKTSNKLLDIASNDALAVKENLTESVSANKYYSDEVMTYSFTGTDEDGVYDSYTLATNLSEYWLSTFLEENGFSDVTVSGKRISHPEMYIFR